MSNPRVIWLIEDKLFEDIKPLLDEIKRQGHDLDLIDYPPLDKNIRNRHPEDACVIFYGSINLGIELQRRTPWVPGPIANFDNFLCSRYYSYWGEHLLNKEYTMLPYAEVCRRRHEICKHFGHLHPEEANMFIRPDDGRKSFGGHVAKEEDFERPGGPVAGYSRPDNLVIAASPKILYDEWRVVICDGKAISGTRYMRNNKLSMSQELPDAVRNKANEIASSEWQPDRLYTLDICDRGYPAGSGGDNPYQEMCLLEANSFSCADIYACDPEPIVREASRVAIEEWKDICDLKYRYHKGSGFSVQR